MSQKLIFTNHVFDAFDELAASYGTAKVFVLVDDNTFTQVLPLFQNQSKAVDSATVITTAAGDSHKSLDALSGIWHKLTQAGATRGSVLINLGGGMVTDMGGFAAATFKRGIHFINIPTTLLAAVDASVGGKTGINFAGLKNEIGSFAEADAVIISTEFFNTLPMQEILSGYAEMLKHGLLQDKATFDALLAYDITDSNKKADPDKLLALIEQSVGIKKKVVDADPHERGIRKALNLGHTIGHAFESMAMERESPIPHGYAVAWGLVVELILSHMKLSFPADTLHSFAAFVKENYGSYPLECKDYPHLIELMAHDKKNVSPDAINFTLLASIGDIRINQTAGTEDIKAALDIFRDLLD